MGDRAVAQRAEDAAKAIMVQAARIAHYYASGGSGYPPLAIAGDLERAWLDLRYTLEKVEQA